jgi:hypothetical protein
MSRHKSRSSRRSRRSRERDRGHHNVTAEEIRTEIEGVNEEALLAGGFDDALIGWVTRMGMSAPVALYDRDKCIKILMARDGMDEDEAEEFFDFNVVGSWMGDGTPCFARVLRMIDTP